MARVRSFAFAATGIAMPPCVRSVLVLVIAGAFAAGIPACEDESAEPDSGEFDEFVRDPVQTQGEPPTIEFPASARVEDDSVNQFIEDLLKHCRDGDYGLYRLAVSTRYEPLSREQFQRAWYAVKTVRIRDIIKVYDPATHPIDPSNPHFRDEYRHPIYCVHATIELREDHHRPVREVIVLIVRENDEWKLGPPASLGLKRKIIGDDTAVEDMVAPPPETSSTAPDADAESISVTTQPATTQPRTN
jgi:hypothetical protein